MTQVKVGRPNKFDRDQAIELAKNAFWKQGYNALSISQLSAIMGITRSSFYNSFSDKQGLFKEVLAQYRMTEPYLMLLDIPETMPVKPRLSDFFKEICRTRVHDQGNQGCLIVNTVSGVIGSDDKLAHDIEALLLSSVELFENLLQRAISQGELPPSFPVQATANALVAFNMGINNLTKVVRDEDQLWEICDTFLKNYHLY